MRYFILNLLLAYAILISETKAASVHEGFSPLQDRQFSRNFPKARTEITIYKIVHNGDIDLRYQTETPTQLLHRLADEISQDRPGVEHLKCVKFSNITNIQDLMCEIKRSLRDDNTYEVDFSSSDVHDDWVEMFVEAMLSSEMHRHVQTIERLNLHNNFIGIAGLQSLIPLLKLNTLKVVDLSNTAIDEEYLEVFGTSEAYNQYTPENHRIILSNQEREALLKKIIWIPKSFFDAQDKSKNPSGMFVTPEVIRQHREYYNLAY